MKPARVTLDKAQRLWTVAFAKRKEKHGQGLITINIGIRIVIEQDSGKIRHWGLRNNKRITRTRQFARYRVNSKSSVTRWAKIIMVMKKRWLP